MKNRGFITRTQSLRALKENPEPSVLIIGGGINGAGTFRDLALNQVNVLLIDRADFCAGASAASSHMAHGGVRYLENGEFRLVREAVAERNRMIENAPHLVRPLPTTIPIFKIWSGLLNAPLKFLGLLDRPSERGALVIKIGLMLYDSYTRAQGTVPGHQFIGKILSHELYPQLHRAVKYTATYYDGAILSPERYLMELILDGETEGPHANALNYLSLDGLKSDKVLVKDELTGAGFEIKPGVIINAAGPWIDQVNSILGINQRYIGGTKGSHLVLDNPGLRNAIRESEFFFENKDGRIVLIFPFFDKVIVGTSDIPIQDPDQVICTDQEVDYFIEMVSRIFPKIKVSREQIIFRYSGVRPLEYSQAKTTGQITRDHSLKEDMVKDIPVYSLVGGKWTSYRAFAEETTDKVLSYLGRSRLADTKILPVGGGQDFEKVRNSLERESPYFDRYGSRYREFEDYQAIAHSQLKNNPGMTREEIRFLASREKIAHLDDLLLRRTLLAYLGQLTLPFVEELAEILADELGWGEERKDSEIKRALEILKDRHEVRLG